MPDTREKLIDIFANSGCSADIDTYAYMADHLIAHGVTVSEEALPVAEKATERSVAVEKIEEKRKPEDFIGHRKPEQEWISVTERLPEYENYVLTYRGESDISVERMFPGASWDFDYDIIDAVTHWMPLPEPPKGDSNG